MQSDAFRPVKTFPRPAVPLLMTTLVMIMFMTTAVFLSEGVAFFQPEWKAWMTDTQFFLTFGVALLLGFIYLIMAKRHFGVGIQWGWLLFFLALFVCDIVAVYLFPATVEGLNYRDQAFSITFSDMERVRFVMTFGISCFLFYCEFGVFPKTITSRRLLSLFPVIFILVGLSMIVFSLFTEMESYRILFGGIKGKFPGIHSYTNNGNSYGFVMMACIGACGYMHTKSRNHIFVILMAVFFVACVTSLSRTSWVTSIVLYLFCAIRWFCNHIKRHPWSAIFTFLWPILILVAVLVLAYTLPQDSNPFRVFIEMFNRKGGGTGNMDARVRMWNAVWTYHLAGNPLRAIFGIGDTQALFYLGAYERSAALRYAYPLHNGLLHMLISGGVIRLVSYFILVGYLFIKGIGVCGRSKVASYCMGLCIVLTVHGMSENTIFLMTDAKGIVVWFLAVFPLLVEAHLVSNESKAMSILEASRTYVAPAKIPSPLANARHAFLYMTPLAFGFLGGLELMRLSGSLLSYPFLNLMILTLGVWLAFPWAVYALSYWKHRGFSRFVGFLFLLLCGGGFYFGLINRGNLMIVIAIAAGLVGLAFLLSLFMVARIKAGIFGFFFKAVIPHLIVVALIVSAAFAFRYSSDVITSYTILAYFAGGLTLAAFLACLPKFTQFAAPFMRNWLKFDAKFIGMFARGEVKERAKDRRYYFEKVKAKTVSA